MSKKEDKVSLLLWMKGNKFLLLKRDKDEHKHSKMWGLAGGRFDDDETKEEALEREVEEETGISIKGKKYKFLEKYPKEKKDIYVFYLEDDDLDLDKVKLSDEHDKADLFSYKEILDLKDKAIPTNLDFIKDYHKTKEL